jgi:hypothetical protein
MEVLQNKITSQTFYDFKGWDNFRTLTPLKITNGFNLEKYYEKY